MAINPMQRKARNSFLIGMLVTLLVTGIIIAILFIQLTNAKKEQKTESASKVKVYALSKDVKSGEKLEYSDFYEVSVDSKTVASDAVYSLYDLFGDEDELIAKIEMTANTLVTSKMVTTKENKLTDDVRKQEYNMISLQTGIENGEYIDIRMMMPSGQDFIVISKKQVEIPVIDGVYSGDTIRLELTEDETLRMSSAIVEAWKISGAKLYATEYVEAGIQEAATPTYLPNSEVWESIRTNPNIVDEAIKGLNEIYNKQLSIRNNYINAALSTEQNAQANLESGMNESVTKTQEDRKTYLETLVPMN